MTTPQTNLDTNGTAAFLRAVLENLSEGVIACNAAGELTTFNRASREFHALIDVTIPPDEWAQHYNLYLADGKTPMKKEDIPLFRALAGQKVKDAELIIEDQGVQRTFCCNGQAIYDEDGKKLGAVITMNEITELKKASAQIRDFNRSLEERVRSRTEELEATNRHLKNEMSERQKIALALTESEKRFRTLFEQSPLSVQLLSVDGRTIQVNSAWKKLWGLSDEFTENFILKEYNMLADAQLVEKGIMPMIQAGFQGTGGKIPAICYDVRVLGEGRERWVEGLIEPIFDEDGKVREVVLIHQDVSDKVEFERELKAAKDAAEESNRLKSAFLANMSHEIRTPLGAILGFTQLLKDPNVTRAEMDEYLAIIDRSGNALTRIIDDILDLSKVEAGRLKIETLPVDVPHLIQEVFTLFKKQSSDRNIELRYSQAGDDPFIVKTDPARLRQVLINLIGNALKFTSAGSVLAEIFVVQKADRKRLQIAVTDTGLGIPKDQQAALFKSFSQVDSSHTRQFGGTGLGLVLSRRLAEAMGGDVFLKASEPGHGSTFVVELPLNLAHQTVGEPGPSSHQSKVPQLLSEMKILVVDDMEDNRVLVKRVLSKRGATIAEASDGAEAVEAALNGTFDVVLMDVQMPIMDGYSAIQALRQKGYKGIIVALTAHAMLEEKNRCLAAGADAHFSKPIVIDGLVKLITSLTKTKA